MNMDPVTVNVLVAVATALVSVVATLLAARHFSERRVLQWECTQTEIGSASKDDHLQLLYDGKPVGRVCVAEITLVNTGNCPLREGEQLEEPL